MKTSSEPVTRELLTVAETAEYLRVSRTQLYKLMRRDAVKFIKLGGRTLFRKSDLDGMIARLAGEAA